MHALKVTILLSSLSTFIWSETITLEPIDIHETNLTSSTFILSEKEARETGTITLQDRLKRDTSFSVVVGDKGEEAISFRGLDFKKTEYVEDGIPLYRNVNGFTDTKFTMTNATLLINDGSGTSSLGVSPIGGEVQITSKTPSKAFESSVNTLLSNNDEYYHASIGSMTDDVYIQANANYYHRSNYTLSSEYDTTPLQDNRERLNSDKDQKNISVKSGIFIEDHIHLAAKASLTRAEYGIPPNIYTDLNATVWDAFTRLDRKDLNSFYLYGDYVRDDLKLSIRAYYDDYEDIYKIYNEPEYRSSWPAVTYDDARLGAVIKAVKSQENHTSTFIFQAEENEHIRRGGDLNTTKSQVDTFKLSFLDLWELNSFWKLEGGLSATLMQTKKSAEASATQPPDDKNTLDAQVKLTHTQEKSALYVSIAKKSRMPTMSEMFTFFPWVKSNPDLKPEKSMQYTLGYQHDLMKHTSIGLSFYYYNIEDLIIYRDSAYINHEEAKHYGAEFHLNSTYFAKHHLRASYAYAHTEDNEGEPFELIPLHQFKLEDTLHMNEKWNAYLGYQYIGSRYSPNSATYSDEQIKLDNYHLLDTQIAYKVSGSTQCSTGIKNILDESYEWKYGYPAQGRSYYFSLEWKL